MKKKIIIVALLLGLFGIICIVYAQTQPIAPLILRFLDLTDVDETTYTGEAGKFVKVNAGENAIEFGTPAGAGDLLADGSVPLTANWDVGAFTITALKFTSDQATGMAPFTVASTTEVANLRAATATIGTNVTITDNENTAENNPVVFVENGDLDGGNLGLESDGDFHYNPSTGTVTATEFVGGGVGLTGLDGEQIANDTIDNDSIDWGDMTDLTTDGALDADVVDEAHIADDGIDSEHYNNGSIDLVHLAAGVYAKDLVTTAPITGAADNIFVGADSDVTVAITLLKDVVATSPILIDGGTNVDDILPGADADLTISVTVAKDIVTTAPLTGAVDNVIIGADADITLGIDILKDLVTTVPLTGGTDNILPGADTDITIALDFTAAWDFGGAASLELPNGTDPDVAVVGQVSIDTDGANETGDSSKRGYDGANQFLYSKKIKHLVIPISNPDALTGWAGRANTSQPVWFNTSGMTFTITEIYAVSDVDNYDFNLFESNSATDMSDENDTLIDLVECETDGTEGYTDTETTISHAAIEHDHAIIFEHSDGDAGGIIIVISGWFDANVD